MTFEEFIKSTGIEFNEQQKAAIRRTEGATLLLAVPGSGKTTTIIARLGYMVKCLGIPADSILTVTYTRAATASMRAMSNRVVGMEYDLEFKTIHGLCAKILAHFERVTGRKLFKLTEGEGMQSKLMHEVFVKLTGNHPTESELKELSTRVTYHRNMMHDDDTIAQESLSYVDFAEFFRAYKQTKIERRLMDYDDQQEYAYTILRQYPRILEYFRDKYKYINVDEAQDISKIQHEIIRLLARDNIFMVGDEDQSIYSFRAAYPEALLEFSDTIKNSSVLLTETNYRSTQQIVSYADRFIHMNVKRFDKAMYASLNEGTPPTLVELHDYANVYAYVMSVLKRSNTETAVLYRNNESAIPLIDLLETNGISYSLRGNNALFFSSRRVADIIGTLKFVHDPLNKELFMQVYYKLGAGISKEMATKAVALHDIYPDQGFIELINKHCTCESHVKTRLEYLPDQLEACRKLSSFDAVRFITENLMGGLNPRRQINDKQKISILLTIAKRYPNAVAFLERLEELNGYCKNGSSNPDCKAILSTIHSSKGLEFERVILLDAKEGVLPAMTPEDIVNEEHKDILEEERRIFYVAVTRAKKEILMFSSLRDNGNVCSRSLFVEEYFGIRSLSVGKASALDKARNKLFGSTRKKTKSVQKVVSAEEKDRIRAGLKAGTIIYHEKLGRCRVASNDGRIIRAVVISSGTVKAFDIHTLVENGLVTLQESTV